MVTAEEVVIPSHRIVDSATASATHRLLTAFGLRASEAGNVIAYAIGLSPVENGWSVREIQRLLFTVYLAEHGRIGS